MSEQIPSPSEIVLVIIVETTPEYYCYDECESHV
jgi:hypothetical protein